MVSCKKAPFEGGMACTFHSHTLKIDTLVAREQASGRLRVQTELAFLRLTQESATKSKKDTQADVLFAFELR